MAKIIVTNLLYHDITKGSKSYESLPLLFIKKNTYQISIFHIIISIMSTSVTFKTSKMSMHKLLVQNHVRVLKILSGGPENIFFFQSSNYFTEEPADLLRAAIEPMGPYQNF